MNFDLSLWLDKLNSLTFAQLANVQTVGIGLYLALAIVQAVSDGGVAGLRRRAVTLDAAIGSAGKSSLRPESSAIITDLGRLEMGFQTTNRTIMVVVLGLFVISVTYFSYCTIFQSYTAFIAGSLSILIYYLLMPVLIFLAAAWHITSRCAKIDGRIRRLQSDYLAAALGG